jgi:hypothetical protein
MNTLPRPKIYENNAVKCRAHRAKKRAERDAFAALTKMLTESRVSAEAPIEQLLEELPEEQKQAVIRVQRRVENGVFSENAAG